METSDNRASTDASMHRRMGSRLDPGSDAGGVVGSRRSRCACGCSVVELVRLLALLGWIGWPGGSRVTAEGTIGTNSTTAILQALFGGGYVQVTTGEILTPEIPLIISMDTVLEGNVGGGRLATFTGANARRLFHVLPGIRFEVRNCVLREGSAIQGGGFYNEGSLLLSNVVMAACKAVGPDGAVGRAGENRFGVGGDGGSGVSGQPGHGGAIFNLAEAVVLDSIFTGNTAQGGKGGDGGDGGTGGWQNGSGGDGGAGADSTGGAIYSAPGSRLVITNTLFVNNSAKAGNGGAGGSDTAVLGSGQGGRGASASGGAIHSAGWLQIVRSTFATNSVSGGNAAPAGAPHFNFGRDGEPGGHAGGGAVAAWGEAAMINTTFVTNTVVGGSGGTGAAGTFTAGSGGTGGDALGGAIHVRGNAGLTNLTVAWNVVTNGAGGVGGSTSLPGSSGSPGRASGSGIASDRANVGLVNSIVVAPGEHPTLHGPVVDLGHNLFSDLGTGSNAAGSLYRSNPRFAEFKVWVELTTPAFELQAGSPAIDAADPASSPTADQRGVLRPVGRGPDIGSMESSASTYRLGGMVYEGEGKAGLAGVVFETGDVQATSDEAGRFDFGYLPPGPYTISIVGGGAGFVPRVRQIPLLGDTTNLVFRFNALTVGYQRTPASGNAGLLKAAGLPNRRYRMEGSPDLVRWQSIGTSTSDREGNVEFRHDPGSVASWYYRMALE